MKNAWVRTLPACWAYNIGPWLKPARWKRAYPGALILIFFCLLFVQQNTSQQKLFEQVFGEHFLFDPAIVSRLRDNPEERIKLDTNKDGRVETIYFIDHDPKHQAEFRPILVKAIDRDGDMERDGGPDLDSDIYFADWHADGMVDSVVEYRDTDHDNTLDEMAIYTFSPHNRYLGKDAIQVWWSRDLGHDHKLWYTINYRYQQPECQFRTDFNGNEMFSSYSFDADKREWIPSFENPFVFYDEDGDDLSEVTMRFSGSGNRMESLRYGVDADNDTVGDRLHDYDFSLTALASRLPDDGASIPVPESLMERIQLPGGPAAPLLSWKNARKFGLSAPWGKVLLTWVENDNNIDSRPQGDPHERWEGVINSKSDFFPQIGGPPVSPYNSRNEVDLDNSGKMNLYYSPVDRRIHLRGADEGWLKADYDYDGKIDMAISYRDTDRDGIVDTWEIDLDGDGKSDRSTQLARVRFVAVPAKYAAFTRFYNSMLTEALAQNQILIDAMKQLLRGLEESFEEDKIETYFTKDLRLYRAEAGIGEKIFKSRAGRRYYQDLIRERYFYRVARALAKRPELLKQLEAKYNAGDYAGVAWFGVPPSGGSTKPPEGGTPNQPSRNRERK
jgi:hypothetical protein